MYMCWYTLHACVEKKKKITIKNKKEGEQN